ncbi:MAG: cation transporter [Planctomycetes bacterium]|nr:cation transporter [Planctomycetota bacterium]
MDRDPPAPAANWLEESAARGGRATAWGIVASSVLAGVKVLAGVLGNSYALIADGIESVLDIVSSLVVWGSLKISAQPANDQHPYGYGKVESLAALVVATALLAAAAGIAVQSAREIRMPHHAPAPFTLLVLVGVVATKEVMFRVLSRTGESIGSRAMVTDAWHHRSDSLTSIAAFIGISVALWAGEGYESADDWAALFAAGVIAFNGIRLFRSAWRDVLDAAPPAEVVDRVRAVAEAVPRVVTIEKCRVRKSGLGMFVDIHVEVDGGITVREGHDVSHDVKDALIAQVPGIRDVLVHIEPAPDE